VEDGTKVDVLGRKSGMSGMRDDAIGDAFSCSCFSCFAR
jgi:hypothetical protein